LLAEHTTVGGLRDLDITVLTLHRGTAVIPNPRDDRELLVDDRLLCFGRLDAMRNLVPERRRRRARPSVKPLPDDPLSVDVDPTP
jgi:ribosomal protein S6--L-glutamate ligase